MSLFCVSNLHFVRTRMSSAKIYLTRREQFSTANRLNSSQLSELENERVYGPCNNKHGYGHNYLLDVTICGHIDQQTGLLMHLTDLKSAIHESVIQLLDHKHLDHDVDYFKQNQLVSTIENLCIFVWKQLDQAIGKYKSTHVNTHIQLYEIRISETDKNSVFYRGE